MTLSLFTATLLTALVLLVFGGSLFWNNKTFASFLKGLPRSRRFTALAFGLGSVWFIYKVSQLGEADFGNHSGKLMILFAAIAALSYFYVPDFLAIRGICICGLLAAGEMLNSAFALYDIGTRHFLTVFAYFVIVLSIYLAVAPYRARDFLDWLFQVQARPKLIGGAIFLYGLVLSIAAFTY
ncbi:MAG: hypothetical protein KJT03_22475 [Verrucomicrobiae bacterium]|nr:hypothetical protein [Verrucomicrobiae bacterium]